MGKQFIVDVGYVDVRYSVLDPLNYNAGNTVVLTDADYTALPASLTRTIKAGTVTTVADPVYPQYPFGGGATQQVSPGAQTAPAVPTSASPLVNPFSRTAAVTVSGGTVSAIAVDGLALGITSGTVIVPFNKAITLTYTVAPAWMWILL